MKAQICSKKQTVWNKSEMGFIRRSNVSTDRNERHAQQNNIVTVGISLQSGEKMSCLTFMDVKEEVHIMTSQLSENRC